MAELKTNQTILLPGKNLNLLTSIFLLWGAGIILGAGFFWLTAEDDAFGDYYLLPWSFLSAIIIFAPSAYFIYKGKFDLFNPLIFAVWSYIFPAFILGSVILTLKWSDPFFMAFIEDARYELPLSLMYVTIGYMGLTAGYFLPVGKVLASTVDKRLPDWKWKPNEVWLGGIFLIIASFGVNLFSFIRGIVGYQKVESVEIFDGLLVFLLILLSEGSILLWLAIFQTKKRAGIFYIVLAVLVAIIPLRTVLLGSRGSLLLSLLPIILAFNYSGRKLKLKHGTIMAVLLVAAIGIGMIYGTTFRNIKGTEARMDAGDYFGQVVATVDYLSDQDPVLVVEEGAMALAERIENLSSLGVVVSNYEKLAPYEAAYNLENNILNDLLYSFIPRFVWPDKPPTSDPRAYSDLYFNYGENSFTITPFGDLLRNFGPIGVPLGMLVLGIYLRLIYSLLIETKNRTMWKVVAYFPLLTVVSYEAFFGTIFPSVIRVVFVLTVSLYLVNLLIRKTKSAQ